MQVKYFDVFGPNSILIACCVEAYCEEGAILKASDGEENTEEWKAYEVFLDEE